MRTHENDPGRGMTEHCDLAAQLRAQLSAQVMQQQFAPWPTTWPLAEPLDPVAGVANTPDATSSDSSEHQSAKKQKTTNTPETSESGRRRKKPTYYVRKDEMKDLQLEIEALQARLQTLEEAKKLGISPSELDDRRNAVGTQLRNIVHSQQYSIASIQSALGGYLNKIDRLPHESTICLSKDKTERHATLLAMKDKTLEDSLRYLAERTRFLDPMVPHAESCRYIAPSGAYCSMNLDVTLFEGVKSVKQVYDALMFYFFNMEISVSEIAGDLTIREDDTAWLEGVTQSRVVSNVTEDLQVELNTAMFSAFYDRHNEYGGGRPFGVIVGDYVDVDELYPYSPAQRVRQDVTALLTVSSETRTKVNAHGKKEEELVVILTRSCLIRLNHAELSLGPCVVQRIRDSIGKWGNAMLVKTREIVYSQVPSSSRCINQFSRGSGYGVTKLLLPRLVLSDEDTCSIDSYEKSKCMQQRSPGNPEKPRQSVKRQKKATYHVRKEEKHSLLAELKRLQAQVQTLQNQKRSDHVARDHSANVVNPQLRDVVHVQESAIASVQSALSGYLSRQTSLPFQVIITLGKDPSERHAALVAIKETQIRNSLWYLMERTRFLDPSAPHAESSQCVTPSGSYCWRRLDRTVFETAKSTRSVFDALMFFLLNKEIIISEVLGGLTLREDDSAWHQGVFQSRIVSNATRDVQVEMNSALFSAFYDQHDVYGGGRPFGVITTDFVNVDELYPYSPSQRVRHDVTAVLAVTSEVRSRVNSNGEEEDEMVVVLTRVCLLQLHDTDLPLPSSVIQEMRDNIGKWGEVMLTTVKDAVHCQAVHQVQPMAL